MKKYVKADKLPFVLSPEEMNNPDAFDMKAHRLNDQAANEERKAQEAQEAKRAELREKYADVLSEVENADSWEDKRVALFDALVPAQGAAETVAGEIIRALCKMAYRWGNDGDIFCIGYGIETAGPAAAYLAANVPGASDLLESTAERIDIADPDYESEYESDLDYFNEYIVKYVLENPELFEQVNEDDIFNYDGTELAEYARTYSFEPYTTGYIEELIANSDEYTWEDFRQWLEDLLRYDLHGSDDAYLHAYARDAFEYEDLDAGQYDGLVDDYDRWLNYYSNELESEYGYPWEEEEEEEDEYEEDDEY